MKWSVGEENECLVGRGPVLENQTIKEQIIKKRSVGLVLEGESFMNFCSSIGSGITFLSFTYLLFKLIKFLIQ